MKTKGSATGRSGEAVGMALGAAGVLAFSLTLPATRVSVPVFGGWFVGFGRSAVAGGIAATVLIASRTGVPGRSVRRHILVASLGVVIGFPLFTALALRHVPATRGAIIIGLLPAATAAVSTIGGRERPGRMFWVAALSGTAIVVIYMATSAESGRVTPADGLLVAAVVCAATGYAAGGVASSAISGWRTISWALVVALPLTVPVTLAAFSRRDFENVTASSIVGFGYLSIISAYVGFLAWYAGLGIGGTARVSQVQLIQPLLTLAWAALLLDELVDPGALVAAVGVVLCVAVSKHAPIMSSLKP